MSLTGKTVAETYKDLLTVQGTTNNQGLEPTRKRVFDGEGIGSPIYLGTTSVEFQGPITTTSNLTVGGDISYTGSISGNGSGLTNVTSEWDGTRTGDSSIVGNLTLTGNITADELHFRPVGLGSAVKVAELDENNRFLMSVDLVTKSNITFLASTAGVDNLVLDANTGTFGKSSKGNMELANTSVALRKGTDKLLEANDDGTIRIKNVSSLPSSPNSGDMVNLNGELYINV